MCSYRDISKGQRPEKYLWREWTCRTVEDEGHVPSLKIFFPLAQEYKIGVSIHGHFAFRASNKCKAPCFSPLHDYPRQFTSSLIHAKGRQLQMETWGHAEGFAGWCVVTTIYQKVREVFAKRMKQQNSWGWRSCSRPQDFLSIGSALQNCRVNPRTLCFSTLQNPSWQQM